MTTNNTEFIPRRKFEELTSATQIQRSQHIDVMTNPKFTGRYYYFVVGEGITTPWIGIDKSGKEVQQAAFATQRELAAWLDPFAPTVEKIMEVGAEMRRPMDRETAESLMASRHPGDEQTLFEATSGPLFEDTEDPMAVLRQAQGEASLAAIPTSEPEPVGEAAESSPYDAVTDEQLKDIVMATKAEFFPAYRDAAILEAKLKAEQQKFDEDNADLIAAKKAAVKTRGLIEVKLKEVASVYGKRTGDREFDKYISFREKTLIEWDEPTILGWCAENYPEALIAPAVVLDEKRFNDYVRDRLKKRLELPPSVVISHPLETLISSKIPVAEEVAA